MKCCCFDSVIVRTYKCTDGRFTVYMPIEGSDIATVVAERHHVVVAALAKGISTHKLRSLKSATGCWKSKVHI